MKKSNVLAFSAEINDDTIIFVCRKKSNLHQITHHQVPQLQSFSITNISSTVLSETSALLAFVAVEQ